MLISNHRFELSKSHCRIYFTYYYGFCTLLPCVTNYYQHCWNGQNETLGLVQVHRLHIYRPRSYTQAKQEHSLPPPPSNRRGRWDVEDANIFDGDALTDSGDQSQHAWCADVEQG
jgi:hypothetical protein